MHTRLLALSIVLLGTPACLTPARVYQKMDADTDAERQEAVSWVTSCLSDRGNGTAVRMAAAKVLGRLRTPAPEAISMLARTLQATDEPAELRALSAWALGQMRAQGSLLALQGALRVPLDTRTGRYVLQGLARHFALIAGEQERLVDLLEDMMFYAGSQQESLPPAFHVLDREARSVPVNVKVLARALDALSHTPAQAQRSAVYAAVLELLTLLDEIREEIRAAPGAWATRIREAVHQSQRAWGLEDRSIRALVLWLLGDLADEPQLAKVAAQALVGSDGTLAGRPSASPSAIERLLAAWALVRMQLHAPGPREALLRDILGREELPAVLRALCAPCRPGEHDAVQKVFGRACLEEER